MDENEILIQNIKTGLEKEKKVKETLEDLVKKLEEISGDIVIEVSVVHEPDGVSKIPEVCQNVSTKFLRVHSVFSQIAAVIEEAPKTMYMKYYTIVHRITRELLCFAAFIHFFEHKRLLTLKDINKFLGIEEDAVIKFHVDIEDLAVVYIDLIEELVRLAMNCVTNGCYSIPFEIAKFVKPLAANIIPFGEELDCSSAKLNMLNINIQQIEQMTYELSVKGIMPSGSETNDCTSN